MAYTPLNVNIYLAAFAGSMAGMGLAGKYPLRDNPDDYAACANVAGAFAEALDTLWGAVANVYDVEAVEAACEGVWAERQPVSDATSDDPASWEDLAAAVIGFVTAGAQYLVAQGIVPPAIPGGATALPLPWRVVGAGSSWVDGTDYGLETRALAAAPTFLLPDAPAKNGEAFALKDGDAQAMTFNMTVTTPGGVTLLEDPYVPGVFATSALLNVPGDIVEWSFSSGRYIVTRRD